MAETIISEKGRVMDNAVNVPPEAIEEFRKWYELDRGRAVLKGKARKIVARILAAAAPKAEPVSDPYKLDSVVRILTGQHKGKTGTIEMEHPVRGLAMRIFLVQIEGRPTANYRADEIEPADTEAPKVEQEPAGKCWVLQRNDFPYAVYASKDKADAACTEARRKENVWCEENKHVADVRVFWNVYPANIDHPAPASDELPNLWWNVEDWEETFDNIEDAYDAATGGEMRGIACLGNAIEQTRKYVVRVDIDTTGDGDADDYEIRTFDSLEAAEQQLAKHKGPQS